MTDTRSRRRGVLAARPNPGPDVPARAVRPALILGVALVMMATPIPIPGQASPPAVDPEIIVSLEARRLWLVAGRDTLLQAPVAVGRRENFRYGGRRYEWETPAGTRTVMAKRRDPVWTVPDWHYFERAAHEGLEVVALERGRRYALPDGSWLGVRNNQVVRGRGTRFWVVPRGRELVIGSVLYVPPHGTVQRRVPGALGTRALDLGDGYLIHGTHEHNEDSIGTAASHGCIRMSTGDVERLFELVAVGTRVRIL
jgi:lipoprotein-anchoring transpeptidase ErfK/SrfK